MAGYLSALAHAFHNAVICVVGGGISRPEGGLKPQAPADLIAKVGGKQSKLGDGHPCCRAKKSSTRTRTRDCQPAEARKWDFFVTVTITVTISKTTGQPVWADPW